MTRPTVLAYYFPSWHPDPRNAEWFGAGWTEWDLLRAARPRFPGHRQPRVPALGYRDESDPAVAAAEVELAVAHGIDGFLFDYYWYDDGPYLNGALDNGFLPAGERMSFALMWANHDLVDIFPAGAAPPEQLKNGAIDRATFETMARHVVTTYFTRPNYLRVAGKPWFTLYDVADFVTGLGGVDEAADALTWFRSLVAEAGHPGLHLDAVLWSAEVVPSTTDKLLSATEAFKRLTVDSGTSYVWLHHQHESTFPQGSIDNLRTSAFAEYTRYAKELPVPFYPNVTVGWDPSPRTTQSLPYTNTGYPYTPVWDQSPADFRQALEQAKAFLADHHPPNPVVTLNAWNEWTEGSYLLPDTTHGLAYLEAVREVFGTSPSA